MEVTGSGEGALLYVSAEPGLDKSWTSDYACSSQWGALWAQANTPGSEWPGFVRLHMDKLYGKVVYVYLSRRCGTSFLTITCLWGTFG